MLASPARPLSGTCDLPRERDAFSSNRHLALRIARRRRGENDIFLDLDLDPERGIVAGQCWARALEEAATCAYSTAEQGQAGALKKIPAAMGRAVSRE